MQGGWKGSGEEGRGRVEGWKTLGIFTNKSFLIVVNTGRRGGAGWVEDEWMARGLLDFLNWHL